MKSESLKNTTPDSGNTLALSETAMRKTTNPLLLIDSAIQPVDAFVDIDFSSYADAICQAEDMTSLERLRTAITLLNEILTIAQRQQQEREEENPSQLHIDSLNSSTTVSPEASK